MALAYGSFYELSHQLRFLLFEMGIALSQQYMDFYITSAQRIYLNKIQQAAIQEGFLSTPIISHHVHDFLDQFRTLLKQTQPESRFYAWDKLYNQCNESIANAALALAYKKCWDLRINKECGDCPTLGQWLEQLSPKQQLLFLDQWGYLGHRISPTLNNTPAYTHREVLQYSPEFQAQFSIHWAAIKKADISFSFDDLLKEEFPQEYSFWQQKLSFHHLDTNDYLPIPLHPWLWRNQLQSHYASMVDKKSLILLPHHQKIMPSMLSNVVMPLTGDSHLKLTTGGNEQREALLHSLLIHEKNYSDTLFFALKNDKLTVNIKAESKPDVFFGFSILQNPTAMLSEGQHVVPLLSLFTESPLTQAPLIDELIQLSHLSPMAYFNHYCHKILLAPLDLWLKHGLSFNVEAEQVAIIFNNYLPQGVILRDMQKINTRLHIFEEQSHAKSTFSGVNHQLRRAFIDSLLKNNIIYWIDYLNKQYHIEHDSLWSCVREVLEHLFTKLKKNVATPALDQQKALLFNEPWYEKPLLSLLLTPHQKESLFIQKKNPLKIT